MAKNIKDVMLIEYLVKIGAKVSNIQSFTNTLSTAFRTNNFAIINMICKMDSVPDNSSYKGYKNDVRINTLTTAVKTGNINLVKIIIGKHAEPDNSETTQNTLSHAITTGNIEIIREILSNRRNSKQQT